MDTLISNLEDQNVENPSLCLKYMNISSSSTVLIKFRVKLNGKLSQSPDKPTILSQYKNEMKGQRWLEFPLKQAWQEKLESLPPNYSEVSKRGKKNLLVSRG